MAVATTPRRPSYSAGTHASRKSLTVSRKPQTVGPFRWLIGAAVRLVAVIAVPAIVFARGATYLYSRGHSTTLITLGAAAMAFGALAVIAASISHHLTGRARWGSMLRWVALPITVCWCAWALLHIARPNAKTTEVQAAYTRIHPVLRFAIATAILADNDLVVTDLSRRPADYRRMGLPVFERTLHYPQADSWVHAADLRTIGHSELHNKSLEWYFRGIGLRTVRHVGTADHLHVELPLRN